MMHVRAFCYLLYESQVCSSNSPKLTLSPVPSTSVTTDVRPVVQGVLPSSPRYPPASLATCPAGGVSRVHGRERPCASLTSRGAGRACWSLPGSTTPLDGCGPWVLPTVCSPPTLAAPGTIPDAMHAPGEGRGRGTDGPGASVS